MAAAGWAESDSEADLEAAGSEAAGSEVGWAGGWAVVAGLDWAAAAVMAAVKPAVAVASITMYHSATIRGHS